MSPAVNRPNTNGTDHQAADGTKQEPTSWVCTHCRVTKPVDDFARNSWTRSGRRHVCKTCRRTYDHKQDYLRRARKYGHIPVFDDFTVADLVECHGDKCYYCSTGSFECIDHFICVRVGGTHTLNNVVPCCNDCNILKRWAVDEPLIRAYRLMMKFGGVGNGNKTQSCPEPWLPGPLPQYYVDPLPELAAIVSLHPDVHPDRYVDTTQKTDVVRSA
jgi:hypothetical protein